MKTRTGLIVIFLSLVATVGIVVAALSQSIPPATIPPETVSSNCGGAITTTSTITATTGALLYQCSGGTAAFDTIAGSSTFKLTGYTQCPLQVVSPCYSNFGYVAHGSTQCVVNATLGSWFNPIAGVTPPTLTFTAGSWDYCAFYAAPSTGGTLQGFSISWS